MDKTTAALLEKLAAKLGTTAEYLWSVLIKQAAISATTTLVYLMFIILFGVLLYKAHRRLSKPSTNNSRREYSIYEDLEWPISVMVVAALLWAIFAIAVFFSIPDIINGYFNPEYWALKEILDEV